MSTLSRRSFLRALGIGAAGIVAPVLVEPVRKIWQVHPNTPLRSSRTFSIATIKINGVEYPVSNVEIGDSEVAVLGDWHHGYAYRSSSGTHEDILARMKVDGDTLDEAVARSRPIGVGHDEVKVEFISMHGDFLLDREYDQVVEDIRANWQSAPTLAIGQPVSAPQSMREFAASRLAYWREQGFDAYGLSEKLKVIL